MTGSPPPASPPEDARPTARPTVSAVIAAYTRDRWDDITAGIEGLRAQTCPADEMILVIDHNPDLFAEATAAFPDVRVVESPNRQGCSGSRNAGIAAATGDVVAFLDDDAYPEHDWLERLIGAFDAPEVMVVGGRAEPVWPDRRPDHLPPELDWLVGCTYLGQPTTRTDVRNPFGCNMAIRADILAEVGGFDENAGRQGYLPLGAEETQFCIRMAQQRPEARVVLEPSALVHHRVSADRTTFAYLRSRSKAEGISKAGLARIVGGSDATSEESGYLLRVLPRGIVRELGRAVRGNGAGLRGAFGIVTCATTTAWWYLRSRVRPPRLGSA